MPDGERHRFGADCSATLVSRRAFLALAAATVAAPAGLWPEDTVPSNLDHILLGVADLDNGIAWVERQTGVRAIFGGVHPGRGTCNALLALGQRRYLEIIAPDPKQHLEGPARPLAAMREPRLFNWAVHTNDIAAAARRAADAGFALDGPAEGSRARPDGRILRWKACRLQDDHGGLLPFFIEWSPESMHPSADAPVGCTLKRLVIQSPAAQELEKQCRSLGVEVSIERAPEPGLRATITSPKGEVNL